MGAKSGSSSKLVPALSFKSSHDSNSNCSVKSHQGTSSSNSSNHNQGKITKLFAYNFDREENVLLDSIIENIAIGIEPIFFGKGHIISENFFPKMFLPAYLGGSTYAHHLSCFLGFKNILSVKLEYGGYYGQTNEYRNPTYYWNEDGLRFTGMAWEEYKDIVEMAKQGNSGGIICRLVIKNKIKLRDLLIKCCQQGNWRAHDYNLASNNCQSFIAKVIEILNVVRDNYSRKLHNGSLLYCPPIIINALEIKILLIS